MLAAGFVGHRRGGPGGGASPRQRDASWPGSRSLPEQDGGRSGTWCRARSLGGPVTLRLGVLRAGVDDTLDLLAHDLDEGLVRAGAGRGMIRWTGEAAPDRLRALAPHRGRPGDPDDPRARPLAGPPRRWATSAPTARA